MNLIEKAMKGISMPTFYKMGSILLCFGVIGAGVNAKMQWLILNIGGKISMVSGFFFQCLFLTLFLTLYFQTRKQSQQTKVIDNPGLDNFLKELKLKDNLKGGSKKNV